MFSKPKGEQELKVPLLDQELEVKIDSLAQEVGFLKNLEAE